MFKATEAFKEAVSIINCVDKERLVKILVFILDKSGETLTKEENNKMATFLTELNPKQINVFVDSSKYIFEQALFYSSNPKQLLQHLVSVGMGEEQGEAYGLVWKKSGSGYVQKMKSKRLGGPMILKEMNWRFQVKLSEKNLSYQKKKSAIFQFIIGEDKRTEKDENIIVEFDKDDLYDFFVNLDTIQSQLDTLKE